MMALYIYFLVFYNICRCKCTLYKKKQQTEFWGCRIGNWQSDEVFHSLFFDRGPAKTWLSIWLHLDAGLLLPQSKEAWIAFVEGQQQRSSFFWKGKRERKHWDAQALKDWNEYHWKRILCLYTVDCFGIQKKLPDTEPGPSCTSSHQIFLVIFLLGHSRFFRFVYNSLKATHRVAYLVCSRIISLAVLLF